MQLQRENRFKKYHKMFQLHKATGRLPLLATIWFVVTMAISSCSLQRDPFDGMTDDAVLSDTEGWKTATLGNYALLKSTAFIRNYVMMGEYPGDNVSLSGTTTDPLFYTYNYHHLKNQGNTLQIWRQGYKVINGCNRLLEVMNAGASPEEDQLMGENLFLRAFVHFSLCRIFGRPYAQNPEKNLGVPVVRRYDIDALPARNTVKEVYDSVQQDLKRAMALMTEEKTNSFASREVAMALMAVVDLYAGDNTDAVAYADSVIESGRYNLVPTTSLPDYFTKDNESNPETIWAIHRTEQDDPAWGSIGSMYYQSPGGLGYGEMYASASYRQLINHYPQDVRHGFIVPVYVKAIDGSDSLDVNGQPIVETRNGFPKYYITKFSNQEGIPTLSSPVILRLAGMYLVRAEANAKLGKTKKAIADVNRIRKRAGLSGSALYQGGDLKGKASVLDVVLEERRLELAFEGYRAFDIFRNNRNLVRNYPGTHLEPGQRRQVIKYTDDRVVEYIPEAEVLLDEHLEQNP